MAWRARSNESKNVKNEQGIFELQKYAAENLLRRSPSIVFGKESLDFDDSAFGVTYKGSSWKDTLRSIRQR